MAEQQGKVNTCANPKCGRTFAARRIRTPGYCGSACRQAAKRERDAPDGCDLTIWYHAAAIGDNDVHAEVECQLDERDGHTCTVRSMRFPAQVKVSWAGNDFAISNEETSCP